MNNTDIFERWLDKYSSKPNSEGNVFWEQWLNLIPMNLRKTRFNRSPLIIRKGKVTVCDLKPFQFNMEILGSTYRTHSVTLTCRPIADAQLATLNQQISQSVEILCSLTANVFPKLLFELFREQGQSLLPQEDEIELTCNCRDDELEEMDDVEEDNLCIHQSSLMYFLGEAFAQNPCLFLSFRGLDINLYEENELKEGKAVLPQDFFLAQQIIPPLSLEGESVSFKGTFPFWSSQYNFAQMLDKIYTDVRTKL